MGVVERSREVMAVMALHEALRNVCINSEWAYSVFWTIRPRPRLRGGVGCKAGDEGSLMLMWEDGYCHGPNTVAGAANESGNEAAMEAMNRSCNMEEGEDEDPVKRAFRKMSIQLYNYGEGLMGKVASDKCHKWVFKESTESDIGPMNYWQSSFDSHPPEWTEQFSAGIQTIAVIQAGHGLLQLGSCKIVAEDLHFVLRMRYTFESLENHSGGFLSQSFAPMRNRFFCGATNNPSIWSNNGSAAQNPQFFNQNSDFRLRLGMRNEAPANPDFMIHQRNDESMTSLRLSLQNGAGSTGQEENESLISLGIKRPAVSALAGRRMAYNKLNLSSLDHPNSNSFGLENSSSPNFGNGVLMMPSPSPNASPRILGSSPSVKPRHSSNNNSPLPSPWPPSEAGSNSGSHPGTPRENKPKDSLLQQSAIAKSPSAPGLSSSWDSLKNPNLEPLDCSNPASGPPRSSRGDSYTDFMESLFDQ